MKIFNEFSMEARTAKEVEMHFSKNQMIVRFILLVRSYEKSLLKTSQDACAKPFQNLPRNFLTLSDNFLYFIFA